MNFYLASISCIAVSLFNMVSWYWISQYVKRTHKHVNYIAHNSIWKTQTQFLLHHIIRIHHMSKHEPCCACCCSFFNAKYNPHEIYYQNWCQFPIAFKIWNLELQFPVRQSTVWQILHILYAYLTNLTDTEVRVETLLQDWVLWENLRDKSAGTLQAPVGCSRLCDIWQRNCHEKAEP